MSKPLIIVESPAKARTIARFLGSDYVVESSIGHIRDLPRNAAEVPAAYREKPWSKLGVDVENEFKPLYIVPREKKEQIKKLKAALKDASEVFLATDEDREGESIAWHLLSVLKPKVPVRRMVFHEITPDAIGRALEHPRDIDDRLVDAQEARRILDRLYGYEVSPVLWKKVQPKLSAGRVQSVAVRVIVDRERERMAFRSAAFWDLEGLFKTEDGENFLATLVALDGKRLATGKDFSETGELEGDALLLDEAAATALADRAHRCRHQGPLGNPQALSPLPIPALPHLDAAAGSRPQAALRDRPNDARRTASLRKRVHHLHAYRQHRSRRDGRGRSPPTDRRHVRAGLRARSTPGVQKQGQERSGGPRSYSPHRRGLQNPGGRCCRDRRG